MVIDIYKVEYLFALSVKVAAMEHLKYNIFLHILNIYQYSGLEKPNRLDKYAFQTYLIILR